MKNAIEVGVRKENAMTTEFINAVYTLKGNRSVRQMGRDCNVAPSYISGILNGKYYPTLKILKRMTKPSSHPQGDISILDLIYLVDEN